MAPSSRLAAWLAAAVGSAAVVISCYTGDIPAAAQPAGNDAGTEGGDGCGGPPTLSAIEDGIFTKSCAFGSCHGATNPAAGLDLTKGKACGSLINRNTCVFANRTRVVPGHPEQSYLYHKVAGDDLGSQPDGTCAGLANGTPQLMPLGAQPLCQGQIDQIKAWIAAGATCDDAVADSGTDSQAPVDSGSEGGPIDGGAEGGGSVVSQLVPSMTQFSPGQQVNVTVVLAAPAPPNGASVALSTTDATVLAVPSAVFVAGGHTTATFALSGLRPGHASVQATSGGQQTSLDELVLGLYLAEVYYHDSDKLQWVRLFNATSMPIDLSQYSLGAGHNSYAETTAQLSGTIAPSSCFVVGGPISDIYNAYPTYSQVFHFAPNLPVGGTGGAGVAILGVPAGSVTASTVPIDAVVYGKGNAGKLLGRDGTTAPVASPDVYAGDSLMMLGGTWTDEYPPYPNSCGL